MRPYRGTFVALSILLAPLAAATAAYVTLPPYFSGTECYAYGYLSDATPEWQTTHIRLTIGGTVVKDIQAPPQSGPDAVRSGPQPDNGLKPDNANQAGCLFDSTHFASGSSVTVLFEGWSTTGEYVSASGSVTVLNAALLYGRNEWENGSDSAAQGATEAASYMSSLNLGVANFQTSLGWTSTDFYGDLSDLSSVSVVYINTHGGSTGTPPAPPTTTVPYKRPGTILLSDFDEEAPTAAYDDINYIYPDNTNYSSSNGTVLASREYAMGSGAPPYNSSGKPPIWFAWNDACLTGNDNAFADAYLWPYTNAYDDNYCEDQAEMGWSITTPVDMSRPGADTVWPWFQAGHTADEARLKLYETYCSYAAAHPDQFEPPNDPGPPTSGDDAARSTIHVYGDWYTRLHGVYTGGPGAVTAWYQ